MENNQTTEELEAIAATPTSDEQTLQESIDEAKKISEFRLKTLSQLIGIHLDAFSAEMIATNGKSYNEKVQAAKALKEAVLFAFDFAVGVTKADIREKGNYAKQTNGLAGVMVQAMDTRFLLLADKMKRDQEATQASAATTNEETNNNETGENTNV